jgi:hypothetical protein
MGELSELMLKWEQVRLKWDDPASRAFEQEFLVPLEPVIRGALTAMDEMADLLAKAQRECE